MKKAEVKLSPENEAWAKQGVKSVDMMFQAIVEMAAGIAHLAVEKKSAESDEFLNSEEMSMFIDANTKIRDAMVSLTITAVSAKQRVEDLEAQQAELTAIEKSDTIAASDDVKAKVYDLFAKLNKGSKG